METATAGPKDRPVYRAPGRKSALTKSVELCDEFMRMFREQMPKEAQTSDVLLGGPTGPRTLGGSTNFAIDLEAGIARLQGERREIVQERERTVEPDVPAKYRNAHKQRLRERDAEIAHEAHGARVAVEKWLAQRNAREATLMACESLRQIERVERRFADKEPTR